MEFEIDDDSDQELIIDETIILSSEEEENENIDKIPQTPNENIFKQNILKPNIAETKYYGNLFHPISITSSDLKDELFLEETNTCNICHESFRYNIGLICHLEMEHVTIPTIDKRNQNKKQKKHNKLKKNSHNRNTPKVNQLKPKKVPNKEISATKSENQITKTLPKVLKKSCEGCRKVFLDDKKYIRHAPQCSSGKFHCVYCKLKFGWESKYKKHLFKIHKLNAAVICKLCSSVFSDMTSLADHTEKCQDVPVHIEKCENNKSSTTKKIEITTNENK